MRLILMLAMLVSQTACRGQARGQLEIIDMGAPVTADSMVAGPNEARPIDVNVRSPGLADLLRQGGRFDLQIGDCAAPGTGERHRVYFKEQRLEDADSAAIAALAPSYYTPLRVMVSPALLRTPNRCARFVGRDGSDVSSNILPMPFR